MALVSTICVFGPFAGVEYDLSATTVELLGFNLHLVKPLVLSTRFEVSLAQLYPAPYLYL